MDAQARRKLLRPGVIERALRADVKELQRQHDSLVVAVELCEVRRQV